MIAGREILCGLVLAYVFSSIRAEDLNVIKFKEIEHDITQKPVPTFWHHALAFSPEATPETLPEVSSVSSLVLEPGDLRVPVAKNWRQPPPRCMSRPVPLAG